MFHDTEHQLNGDWNAELRATPPKPPRPVIPAARVRDRRHVGTSHGVGGHVGFVEGLVDASVSESG